MPCAGEEGAAVFAVRLCVCPKTAEVKVGDVVATATAERPCVWPIVAVKAGELVATALAVRACVAPEAKTGVPCDGGPVAMALPVSTWV